MMARSAPSSSASSTVSQGGWPRRGGTLAARRFDLLFDPGQIDLEHRAPPGLAVDHDVSAALLDDPVDGGEPQPRPFARLLGREEGLEDARLRLAVDAVAGVAHGQHD